MTCRFHGRAMLGVVLEVADRPPPEGMQLRAIDEVVDDEPSVPLELLRFLQELSAYYLAPIGKSCAAPCQLSSASAHPNSASGACSTRRWAKKWEAVWSR